MGFYVREPLPHQKVLFKELNVPLFWQQGLGKTKVAIDNWRFRRAKAVKNLRCMYFCPSYLLNSIYNEFLKDTTCTEDNIQVVSGDLNTRISKLTGNHYVYILSYESSIPVKRGKEIDKRMMTAILNKMDEDKWMVIADESSCISNPSNRSHKLMMEVGKKAFCKWVLNGTPYRKYSDDFFGQFMFLDGQFMGHTRITSYRNEFLNMITSGNARFPTGDIKHKLAEVKEFVHKRASVLRKELLKLPDKIYIEVPIEVPGKLKAYYRELEEDGITVLNEEPIMALHLLSKNIRLRQIISGIDPNIGTVLRCDGDKYSVLKDYYDNDLGYQRGIIWCSFIAEFEEVKRMLGKDKGVAFIRGGMKPEEVKRIVKGYCEGTYKCIVAIQQTIYKGVTLLPTDYEYYLSNVYSFEIRAQSEDRAHRIGQTKGLRIIDVYYKGVIEKKVLDVLKDKTNRERQVMGEQKRCTRCKGVVEYGHKYLCEKCSPVKLQ